MPYFVSLNYYFNNVYYSNHFFFKNNFFVWIIFYSSIIKWQSKLSCKVNYQIGTIIFKSLYYISSISNSVRVPLEKKRLNSILIPALLNTPINRPKRCFWINYL